MSAFTYSTDAFAIDAPEGWSNTTVHTLQGPTVAGHAHAIVIQTFFDVEADDLDAFAEPLIEGAAEALRAGVLLMQDTIALDEPASSARQDAAQRRTHQRDARQRSSRERRGAPSRGRPSYEAKRGRDPRGPAPEARRVIFRWHPENADQMHYQEQLFVFSGGTGYVLSASFTQDSRREAGEAVERVMRSFRPQEA